MISRFVLIVLIITSLGNHLLGASSVESRIATVVKQYVISELELTDETVVVQCLSELPDWVQKHTIKDIQINRNHNHKVVGMTHLKLQFISTNQSRFSWKSTFKVSIFKKVLVARKTIRRLKQIKPSDLIRQKMDITYLIGKETIYSKLNQIVRYRSISYIGKNKVITSTKIEPIPLIDKNKKLVVVAIYKGVRAMYDGLAASEGNKGDVIQVVNVKSQRTFLARVVDANHVEVIF